MLLESIFLTKGKRSISTSVLEQPSKFRVKVAKVITGKGRFRQVQLA